MPTRNEPEPPRAPEDAAASVERRPMSFLDLLVPGDALEPVRAAARARARARTAAGWPIGAGPLDRDGLHERG